MSTSEARISANRANSVHSTGPKTAEGKARSRCNGLKHGMTGQGIVIPKEDRDEVERREKALQAELNPQSCLGEIMVRELATLSVRMERGAKQESFALAVRVRHAAEDFDEVRLDEADRLLDAISVDPRGHLRKLRKSPEGIDLLIKAWEELRTDLTREPRPFWTTSDQEKAENLTGCKIGEAPGSRIKILSEAIRGDFQNLADHEGTGLEDEAREAWARARMVERIEAEISDLEAHYETLDFKTIDLDRSEAADRALFDPSREATLARRYESEARRGFFQALKEFRRAEAEAAERPDPPATPEPVLSHDPLASSWDGPTSPRASSPTNPRSTTSTVAEDLQRSDGRLVTAGQPRNGQG